MLETWNWSWILTTLLSLLSDLCVAGELPSMDDIMTLCKHLHLMRMLCNHFLPCVVGGKWWKMQILAGKKVNKIATVLDEAFVLLVLENIWNDMIKVNIDKYYWPKKRKKKSNDEINQEPTGAADLEHSNKKSSNVNLEDTIITNSENCSKNKVITGKWTSAWHGSCQYGGWSPEGLSHFNKLVKMVIQDR